MAKGNGKKGKPKLPSGIKIEKDKTPRVANGEDFYQSSPTWRFSFLELAAPYGWSEINQETLFSIYHRLSELERLKWREILIDNKKWNHEIEVERLCKTAQDRLIELRQDDVDFLCSIRLTKKERIWGIRENSVLKLLWWDPEHDVYPMNIADN